MNSEKARKIFERYNPASGVIRCPNGRAAIRKLMDSYARAAVNLYGIISRDAFVEIFNDQNAEKTTADELYVLLLPLVLKNGWYGFYKEYLVHYSFFNDFGPVPYLLEQQGNKPRYIPERDEFLKHALEGYEDDDGWWNVHKFMLESFGYSKKLGGCYQEVRDYISYGNGIKELGPILDKHGLTFSSEKQLQTFLDLLMSAKNNTRLWENNGYTPAELHELISKRNKNIVRFPTLSKPRVGRNDPCPCGSGRKYKKCCALFNDAGTAQLSSDECRLFYETWYGLMGFVNERERVIRHKIKPEYPNAVSDMLIHRVREVLWENPELISEYISRTKLSEEKAGILGLWRQNHKKGMILILEYQPEYAVALASNEQGKDRLYGIKGISNSLAHALRRDLPAQVETVLLPFKGKIIYDSFMSSLQIGFGEGAEEVFRDVYDRAIKHGIITTLE